MLELQTIRNHTDEVKRRLTIRGFKEIEAVDQVIAIDEVRRKSIHELQQLQQQSNSLAKSIGALYKEGKAQEANEAKDQASAFKSELKYGEDELKELEVRMKELLLSIPNMAHESVPQGNSEEDNEVVKESGTIPTLKNSIPHWDLMERHNIVSLALGNKITGAGFPVFIGKGARLQRSLVQFFLDEATNAGYLEYIPPFLVNEASAIGTGQLPDKEGQMYHATEDNLFLIPTAEVPVTNIYRDEILNQDQLPIKMTAHSPCFRREAGSYGSDVRGLNRVHQFEKVEIIQIVEGKDSYNTLQDMVNHVESIVQKLKLPYRILRLCGGDLGFNSALTFDFEVYSAAQEKWLEVSSVSNFESYQTNRMKARVRTENGNELLHSLNGSALALPRIMASILENYQNEDSSITIPDVLVPYTGFDKIG